MTGTEDIENTILVVDDNPDNLRVLSQILTDYGLEVLIATDGEMAIAQATYAPPDLILLDVLMPGMTGFETCAQLKATPQTQTIPVILMTALTETVDKVKGFSLGAVDYMTKPLQADEVLARIKVHLELRRLTQQLKQKNAILEQTNDDLMREVLDRQQAEQAIQQKSAELATALQQLQNTQAELVQSEKMAVLGQLVASVAHEINTPLGAMQASITNISSALEHLLQELPQTVRQLSPQRWQDFLDLLKVACETQPSFSFREERQLKRRLKAELTERAIANADLLANLLSRMGIAEHLSRWEPLLQEPDNRLILETAYNLFAMQTNSQNIKLSVERATKIVFSLKSYSHSNATGRMTEASITEGIDIVLTLYANLLKQGIEVRKSYSQIPNILCYPEELNQVWTNLIHNAIQAMHYQGKLTIHVAEQDDHIVVQITDSGCGIPPAIQAQIFQPFFTTKPMGEGSGLGLDIVRKIVEKHRGTITVESEPGQTTFTVSLPAQRT